MRQYVRKYRSMSDTDTQFRHTQNSAQFYRVPQAPVLLLRLFPSFVDVHYKPRCSDIWCTEYLPEYFLGSTPSGG